MASSAASMFCAAFSPAKQPPAPSGPQQAQVQPHGKPQPAPAHGARGARHPAHGGIAGKAVQNQHRQPCRGDKGIEQPACRKKHGVLIFFGTRK